MTDDLMRLIRRLVEDGCEREVVSFAGEYVSLECFWCGGEGDRYIDEIDWKHEADCPYIEALRITAVQST